MKIVKIMGGIGNQLFQYSFAKLLKEKTGEEVYLDYTFFTNQNGSVIRTPMIQRLNITLPIATKEQIDSLCLFKHKAKSLTYCNKFEILVEKLFNPKYYREINRGYTDLEKVEQYELFDGYWQSWRHVYNIWDAIKDELTPVKDLSEKSSITRDKMISQNSVFIGVRRGDFQGARYSHFGSFESDYYNRAISKIERAVDNPVYYIFSNDIEWCKTNLKLKANNIIYRNPSDQTDDFEEFMLMSSCKHAIIANSTFHWWAAKLIDNPQKIIVCPERWFFDDASIDILPPEWIRVKNSELHFE